MKILAAVLISLVTWDFVSSNCGREGALCVSTPVCSKLIFLGEWVGLTPSESKIYSVLSPDLPEFLCSEPHWFQESEQCWEIEVCTRVLHLLMKSCTRFFLSYSLIAGWSVPPTFPLSVILDIKNLHYTYLTYLNIHLIYMIPHSLPQIKGQLALHTGRVQQPQGCWNSAPIALGKTVLGPGCSQSQHLLRGFKLLVSGSQEWKEKCLRFLIKLHVSESSLTFFFH